MRFNHISILSRTLLKAAIVTALTTSFIGCASGGESGGVNIAGEIVFDVADPNATESTKVLFNNLVASRQEGVILGQQRAFIEDKKSNGWREFDSECDISKLTGRYPILVGEDLSTLTDDKNDFSSNWYHNQSEAIRNWVQECHKMGIFVTFSWHFNEPYSGEDFYVKYLENGEEERAFKSILEGGENHDYFKAKLTLIANFFKSCVDEDGELIPIIFRPFHEMYGSFFWWGVDHYGTYDEYVENWQFMVDYLRNRCGVHNLLYAFSPNRTAILESDYLRCYPGDDYVDIIGVDNYADYYTGGNSARQEIITQLKMIWSVAKSRGKVAAFTEFGYDFKEGAAVDDLFCNWHKKAIEESGAEISYMMLWYNSSDHYFIPEDDSTEAQKEDFRSFVESDTILLKGDIESPLTPIIKL